MSKRITKTEAIEAIEKALTKQIGHIEHLRENRDNPLANETYHRACGKAEAYLDVLDVLKLNSLASITC